MGVWLLRNHGEARPKSGLCEHFFAPYFLYYTPLTPCCHESKGGMLWAPDVLAMIFRDSYCAEGAPQAPNLDPNLYQLCTIYKIGAHRTDPTRIQDGPEQGPIEKFLDCCYCYYYHYHQSPPATMPQKKLCDCWLRKRKSRRCPPRPPCLIVP